MRMFSFSQLPTLSIRFSALGSFNPFF